MPNTPRKRGIFRTLRNKITNWRTKNNHTRRKELWNSRVRFRQVKKTGYTTEPNNFNPENYNAHTVNISNWKAKVGNAEYSNGNIPFNLKPSIHRSERSQILSMKPPGYTNSQWLTEFEQR